MKILIEESVLRQALAFLENGNFVYPTNLHVAISSALDAAENAEMLERALAATQHVVAQFSEGARKLRAELAAKTKELAYAIDTLVKERDELVAAIKEVIDDAEECLDHDEWAAMLVSLDAFHNLSTAYEAALAKLGAEVTASME